MSASTAVVKSHHQAALVLTYLSVIFFLKSMAVPPTVMERQLTKSPRGLVKKKRDRRQVCNQPLRSFFGLRLMTMSLQQQPQRGAAPLLISARLCAKPQHACRC